ncbi:MAG: 50S ribosomal protein L13 [Deltaproteobacteria bacterium]|nr:50S ribosomal protein L13 [Deltaproteobacteria bacterium]
MKRTYIATRENALDSRQWHLIDAQGQVLGRLASRIAVLLRGKHKPTFTEHEDTGDFVIVINAAGVRLTGRKVQDKIYRRHTGYPGGVRAATAAEVLSHHPERVLQAAVVGMLPKNRLGRRLATKVKIYPGPDHPHVAQRPVAG